MSRSAQMTRWALSLALAFVLCGAATYCSLALVADRYDLAPGGGGTMLRLEEIDARLAQLLATRDRPRLLRIAYLGDSTVASNTRRSSLPFLLERKLNQNRARQVGRVEVHTLAFPAMGIVPYSFLMADIVEARPDLIIWQISFAHTSKYWLEVYNHRKFSGRLPLAQIMRLMGLPLHRLGMTFDELLLYKALFMLELEQAWRSLSIEQSRVAQFPDQVEALLEPFVAGKPLREFRHETHLIHSRAAMNRAGRMEHSDQQAALRHIGAAAQGMKPDHIALVLLGMALEIAADARIPTIVYLNPVNIEHMADIGALREEALAKSVAAIREVTRRSPSVHL